MRWRSSYLLCIGVLKLNEVIFFSATVPSPSNRDRIMLVVLFSRHECTAINIQILVPLLGTTLVPLVPFSVALLSFRFLNCKQHLFFKRT